MDVIDQTRFKYGLIFCAIVFVEGVIKHFLDGFPFETAVYVQAAAVGLYTVGKSFNNQATIKMNGKSNATIVRDPDKVS